MSDEPSTLLLCARILPGREAEFGQWQVSWQTAALAAGALSVEFWPPAPPDQLEAVVDRALPLRRCLAQMAARRRSIASLIEQVAPLAEGGLVMQLVGQAAVEYSVRHGVTMVMVTDIKPGKEAAYRAWADRIQKLQATFPGYIGSFVQPPQHRETGWTTVLRFDSAEHLDGWLKSEARAAMVKESEDAGRKASTRSGSTRRFRAGFRTIPPPESRPTGGRRHASFCSRCFRSSCWNLGFSIRTCGAQPRRRHLHRQCDQRGADHLAADSAGHLWLPRLAVSRESAALAGADDADRARALLRARDRAALASAVVEISLPDCLLEPRQIGRRIDIGENAGRRDRHFDSRVPRAAAAGAWRRHRR